MSAEIKSSAPPSSAPRFLCCPPFPRHAQARPNSIALFVPAEITSFAFYDGNEKERIVANVLFR